jgi:glycosyltransferase involved in cell wall biosynthesis
LFNEIEAQGDCALEVGYLRSHDSARQWQPAEIEHVSTALDNGGMMRARQAVRNADFVVFNYYRNANAERLIDERVAQGGPWCFWGERPGFHQVALVGLLLRKWKLAKLHSSPAPIWGIGKFAIDGYRKEFGTERAYFNLPYFSNLQRFRPTMREERNERVFLFSGSLIARKGIDLLAGAFVKLANEVSNVRLRIVGDGELAESVMRQLSTVRDRVDFVGFRDWRELPGEYACADVLCVPSRYDGWGLVVPEGLAAGLPVIGTDRMGAALEFVETGRNGWLVPVGDGEALLCAMREAALLPSSDLSGLGQRAQESVREHTLANGAARFFRFAKEGTDLNV